MSIMMKSWKLAALMALLAITSNNVDAFSAHLSRPWERPHRGSALAKYLRRRKEDRRKASSVASAAAAVVTGGSTSEGSAASGSTTTSLAATREGDDKVSSRQQGANNDDDEDEERMVLEEAPRVFIAPSTGGVAAAEAAPASSTSAVAATSSTTASTALTIRSSLKELWAMCRPTNFMGVIVFHVLGSYLGILRANQAATAAAPKLLTLLRNPQMCIVLFSLLLTSSTSMMVNDYYDTRSGVDARKANKPMVQGQVPLKVVKRFLSGLYAALLLSLTMVPGVPARLSIMLGSMLTFWYTVHLKPITWLKNVVCASLIALAPFTSGAAALELIVPGKQAQSLLMSSSPLWRMFGMLFCGFVGREIMMDINDVVDDRLAKVKTVPVKYGRKFASTVSLTLTLIMSALCCIGTTSRRQLGLALAGSLAQSFRAFQVFATNGEDKGVVDRAIEEGKTSVLLLLASFV